MAARSSTPSDDRLPSGRELVPQQNRSEADARPEISSEELARRAYDRYQARGAEHGRDQEDWFEAEQELREGATRRNDQVAGDVDARRLEPEGE